VPLDRRHDPRATLRRTAMGRDCMLKRAANRKERLDLAMDASQLWLKRPHPRLVKRLVRAMWVEPASEDLARMRHHVRASRVGSVRPLPDNRSERSLPIGGRDVLGSDTKLASCRADREQFLVAEIRHSGADVLKHGVDCRLRAWLWRRRCPWRGDWSRVR